MCLNKEQLKDYKKIGVLDQKRKLTRRIQHRWCSGTKNLRMKKGKNGGNSISQLRKKPKAAWQFLARALAWVPLEKKRKDKRNRKERSKNLTGDVSVKKKNLLRFRGTGSKSRLIAITKTGKSRNDMGAVR